MTFWFVEQVEKEQPGTMIKFRRFLEEIKPMLIGHAQMAYARKRVEKLGKFEEYLERIYEAAMEGQGSEGRMRILYHGMKTPSAMKRLNEILAKF